MDEFIEDAIEIIEDIGIMIFSDHDVYRGYTKRDFNRVINNLCKIEKESKYIGKKDINNKKIYADCSIFKFKYGHDKNMQEVVGYITFCENDLSYGIVPLHNGNKCPQYNWSCFFTDIEIIDTIQENKLGLIK